MKTMIPICFLTFFCLPQLLNAQCLWSDFSFQKVSGCLPVKYKFTDASTACESIVTDWYWEFGDGTTSTEQNPEHDFASAQQFVIKLTVTDNLGNSIRRTKRLTVVPSTLSVDLGSDSTICFGSSLTLDAGIAGATYAWSTGETTQAIEARDDGDYIVTVQSGGCTAKDTVRVNTSASVLNKWSYNVTGTCLPVLVNFADSSVAFCGQSITSWHWDFGDGTFSADKNAVHAFSSADTFIVKLTVTTSSGSTSTSTKKIAITNSMHSVNIPSQLKVCTGESLTIDAGVAGADYTWGPSFGVEDVKAKAATIKPMLNAWYYVDVLKCMVNVRDSVFIVVDSISKPGIVQNENYLVTGDAVAYVWYRDGVQISNAGARSLRIDRHGYYAVKVFNQSGCERMSDAVFFMPKSMGDKAGELGQIKCSPNPGNGKFSVLMSVLPGKPGTLTVNDRFGRIIYSASVTGNVTPVDLTGSPKGLYYVVVNMDNSRKILAVVTQ